MAKKHSNAKRGTCLHIGAVGRPGVLIPSGMATSCQVAQYAQCMMSDERGGNLQNTACVSFASGVLCMPFDA